MNSKFSNAPRIVFDTKKTTFCKVCHDAKRDGYDTHYVKNHDGKVTCPYLLSLNCNYCRNPGHTVKYCDVLKNRKQNEKYERRPQTYTRDGWTCKETPGKFRILGLDTEKKIENVPHLNKKNNIFFELEEEDDEDKMKQSTTTVAETEFPVLSSATAIDDQQFQKQDNQVSWANIAATVPVISESAKLVKLSNVQKYQQQKQQEYKETKRVVSLVRSWADDTDDDEDDESY